MKLTSLDFKKYTVSTFLYTVELFGVFFPNNVEHELCGDTMLMTLYPFISFKTLNSLMKVLNCSLYSKLLILSIFI